MNKDPLTYENLKILSSKWKNILYFKLKDQAELN